MFTSGTWVCVNRLHERWRSRKWLICCNVWLVKLNLTTWLWTQTGGKIGTLQILRRRRRRRRRMQMDKVPALWDRTFIWNFLSSLLHLRLTLCWKSFVGILSMERIEIIMFLGLVDFAFSEDGASSGLSHWASCRSKRTPREVFEDPCLLLYQEHKGWDDSSVPLQ